MPFYCTNIASKYMEISYSKGVIAICFIIPRTAPNALTEISTLFTLLFYDVEAELPLIYVKAFVM